jgi:hypothetical protein
MFADRVKLAVFAPALVAHLDVLTPHKHNISNIKEVDPVHLRQSSTASLVTFDRLGNTKGISLSLLVHVGLPF